MPPSTNRPTDSPHPAYIRLQRAALVGDAAAMVAHEFNNLMTPVVARAQLALSLDEPASMRKALDVTLKQAGRALAITRQILEVASEGEDQPVDCGVAEAFQGALDAMARPLEKDRVELQVDISPGLTVRAVPVLFEQVLLTLIRETRAVMLERGGGRIKITAEPADDSITLKIRDNLSDVDAGWIASTLTPFLAADSKCEPCDWDVVGLSWCVCRWITQRHGATIRVSANEDSGRTVSIDWPTK